jgi:hypothetical protein
MESDSHVMKRTLPLKPFTGGGEDFKAAPNDPNATVYLGEGCWGAPLRRADVNYSWTVGTAAFNGFDWLHVTPGAIFDKTVKVGKRCPRWARWILKTPIATQKASNFGLRTEGMRS